MKIAIGSDHAGYLYKEEVIKYLKEKGHSVIDFGTHSEESCDYPTFGKEVGYCVVKNEADLGIVICATGEGIMISANKVPGVRCGLAYNNDVSRLMRRHNGCNVIAFGAKEMPLKAVFRRIDIFLKTKPAKGRHLRRRNAIE